MAKIIAAEKIKLDSVTIEKNAGGKLVFDNVVQADVSVTGSLESRQSVTEVAQTSLTSSLETRVSVQESTASDIQNNGVDSIETRLSAEEVEMDSKAGSLTTRLSAEEVEMDSKTGSLTTRISASEVSIQGTIQRIDNNIRVSNFAISSGAQSITCDYTGFGFTATQSPKVMGQIKNNVSGDPIVICQLRSVSNTEAIFDFSDDIAGTGYSMDIILSVEPQGHAS